MTKKSLWSRYWLVLIAFLMLGYMLFAVFNHPKPKLTEPAIKPTLSPFGNSIGGIGTIEPESENIAIAATLPGIITKIYVQAGQKVKMNQPLFAIDSRDALARLANEKAKLIYALAALREAKHQLQFYESVDDKRAISVEEMTRRKDAVALSSARLQEAQAAIDIVSTEVNRLTVKSPIDASILKIYAHLGEYAQAAQIDPPLMVLGNLDVMHVRVEVDETNAYGISAKAKATGFLRGHNTQAIPLTFVRIEPLLLSKKSLSNQGSELVDTRVLVILYSFDNVVVKAHTGQQMDVYIDYEKDPISTK